MELRRRQIISEIYQASTSDNGKMSFANAPTDLEGFVLLIALTDFIDSQVPKPEYIPEDAFSFINRELRKFENQDLYENPYQPNSFTYKKPHVVRRTRLQRKYDNY